MKTLILYTSKCGSAKRYSEDIAKAVGAEVFPLKKFNLKRAKNYDTIVFGGWVKGGTIEGLNKFLTEYEAIKTKNVIVFSTGMSVPSSEGRSLLIEQNLLDLYHIRFYQLRGSFDMAKLDFFSKLLIQNSLKMIANDPSSTEEQKALAGIKEKPIDYYDQEKVDRIVSVILTLQQAAN